MKTTLTILALLTVNFGFGQLYDFYLQKIKVAVNIGDNENAEYYLAKSMLKYPDSSELYFQKGGLYLFDRRLEESINNFNKAIELGYGDDEVYKFRGIALQALGKFESAERDYAKYLTNNPIDSTIYIKYATVVFEQGRLSEAHEMISTFESNNPSLYEGYLLQGLILHDQGKKSESINKFTKAIEVNPNIGLSYVLRARGYEELDDATSQCEDLLKALHLGKYEQMTWFRNVNCYDVLDLLNPDSKYKLPAPPPEIINN